MRDDPECPHCGEELTDLWDYGWDDDFEDESINSECGWCEKPVTIKRRVWLWYEVHDQQPQRKD
jgi:hypothetical protein